MLRDRVGGSSARQAGPFDNPAPDQFDLILRQTFVPLGWHLTIMYQFKQRAFIGLSRHQDCTRFSTSSQGIGRRQIQSRGLLRFAVTLAAFRVEDRLNLSLIFDGIPIGSVHCMTGTGEDDADANPLSQFHRFQLTIQYFVEAQRLPCRLVRSSKSL